MLLWNTYNYFVTYAIIDKFKIQNTKYETGNVLDRWITSRLNNLIKTVTENLEKFDAYFASLEIEKFVDDFSTWYLRRSRNRTGDDRKCFYAASHKVLLTLSKLLAPFIPFLAEEIFKNLSNEDEESVHLQDWPSFNQPLIDDKLEVLMETVRKVCELGHAKRKDAGIKVRQPLSKLKIQKSEFKIDDSLIELIKDELNVKQVEFTEGKGETQVSFDTQITPELKEEGEARDLIRQVQEARKIAGCGLSEKIKLGLPSWPKNFEEEIKNKTFSQEIVHTEKIEVIRNV